MKAYTDICNYVIHQGDEKVGRNGKTLSVSGVMFRHNMQHGFPIPTIRYMSIKMAMVELRFFINGYTHKSWLRERGNKFWEKWCDKTSLSYFQYLRQGYDKGRAQELCDELGPIYGSQWRNFNGADCDQLRNAIALLLTEPNSRRIFVSAWNPLQLTEMALPPCHDSFQFLANNGELDLIWRQRSCDVAIGLPYDILLYGLLLEMVAKTVNMKPRWLIGQLGDTHIYESNLEALRGCITRTPHILPELILPDYDIFQFAASDELASKVVLSNYVSHPSVKFEVVA